MGVLVEHECPRCQREVELPLGELCPVCRKEIERRASRIGRMVALASTVAVGIYVMVKMPEEPTPRMVGAMSIAIWYLLTYLVVKRVLREYLQ